MAICLLDSESVKTIECGGQGAADKPMARPSLCASRLVCINVFGLSGEGEIGEGMAIVRMIESGPIPAVHGVVHWRLIDLAQWIFEEFRITIAKQTLSRELRAMGYRKLSARPRHYAQAAGAIEDFKKASPRAWTQSRVRTRSASTR